MIVPFATHTIWGGGGPLRFLPCPPLREGSDRAAEHRDAEHRDDGPGDADEIAAERAVEPAEREAGANPEAMQQRGRGHEAEAVEQTRRGLGCLDAVRIAAEDG